MSNTTNTTTTNNKKFNNLKEHRINAQIRAKRVFLIDESGQKVGEVPIYEAVAKATELHLDLVEMARNEDVPVCKLMDYGRYCFSLKKNLSKARKENKCKEKKEVQVRPNIEENDFQVKLKRLSEFLQTGYKVDVILKFKGRQITHPELGLNVLKRFAKEVEEFAKVESHPVVEGKRANMLLGPLKK